MSWIKTLFARLKSDVDSPEMVAVEKEIETLLPAAVGIMSEIEAAAPNKTFAELDTIATKYAVPGVAALASGASLGTEAITIGAQILQKNHAPAAAIGLLTTIAGLAAQAVKPTPTPVPAKA